MKQVFFLFATITSVWICSCSKIPERKVHHINPGLKNYFNYKVGSYWIFRDSVNNEVDSLAIVQNQTSINDEGYKNTGSYDVYEGNTITGYLYFRNQSSDSSLTIMLGIYDAHCQLVIGNKTDDKIIYQDFLKNYPFAEGAFFNNSDTGIVTLIPKDNIAGSTYDSIYSVSLSNRISNKTDAFKINRTEGFITMLLDDHSIIKRKKLYLIKSNVIR